VSTDDHTPERMGMHRRLTHSGVEMVCALPWRWHKAAAGEARIARYARLAPNTTRRPYLYHWSVVRTKVRKKAIEVWDRRFLSGALIVTGGSWGGHGSFARFSRWRRPVLATYCIYAT